MKLTSAVTLLSTAALLLAPADRSAAAVLQARSADGDLIVASIAGQESSLIAADGTRVALPLPPTALVHSFDAVGERWYAAAVDSTPAGRRLALLEGSGSKAGAIAAPIIEQAAQLREPSLLLDGTGLRGLAWIEGPAPRRQRLRAAAWAADGWSDPVTVSPPGPGSQMALAATRLDDGAWLLAWAAFDGTDDEILWSRWTPEGATPAVRLGDDNAVPDITPHLAATPGGALAAWSRYDGNDYRLHLARYDGLTWSTPRAVGPAGSVYPTFHRGTDRPLLTYLKSVPRGWVVAEIDGEDRIRRQAEIETLRGETPLVRSVSPDAVSLMWIGDEGEPEIVSGLTWKDVKSGRTPRSDPE